MIIGPKGLLDDGAVEHVPTFLVRGVADDGTEYELPGFGSWMDTYLKDCERWRLYEKGFLSTRLTANYWLWAARKDPAPRRLKIYIRVNPEYLELISLKQARDFVWAKINDQALAERSLLRAFRNGHIKTRGIVERDKDGNLVAMKDVHLKTSDLIRWLEYEHGVKATVNEAVSWPDSPLVLDVVMKKK